MEQHWVSQRETSLKLSGFEDDTIIDTEDATTFKLSQDILSTKTKPAEGITDGGTVDRIEEHNRLIETFKVGGLAVVNITVQDVDVYAKGYSNCRVAKEVKREFNSAIGTAPALDDEQWVAARYILVRAGQVGGLTQDYWQRTRDIAQQRLFLNLRIQEQVWEQVGEGLGGDAAIRRMLELVKRGSNFSGSSESSWHFAAVPREPFNQYHQAQRDRYVVDNDLFFHVKDTDFVVMLDKAAKINAFQCADAFRKFITKRVEKKVT
ncbi:hypothetical protein DL771_012187 [Monosporascus sp. 5C6A]|nr:hypothetical protein DL771_012187 [Monosporascus sp. 5C6A]